MKEVSGWLLTRPRIGFRDLGVVGVPSECVMVVSLGVGFLQLWPSAASELTKLKQKTQFHSLFQGASVPWPWPT